MDKRRLLYSAAGIVLGWICGGLLNVALFLYAVEVLGYRDSAPDWYISAQGIMRPAVIFAGITAGYLLSQRVFHLTYCKRQEERQG